jgi:YVTN family beta-propeller protein
MAELFSGTVTFLFTDIEGSTRLVREYRDRWGEALADHARIIREAVAEADGREIDTQGDAFFIAFPRAKNAVEAAAEVQRALAAHDWPDGMQMRVRMGIHTGEPALAEERYLGLAVHRAARICSAAHGGQVLLSSTATDLVTDELPTGIQLRPLGNVSLKDFDQPERLSQLVVDGLAQDFPPPRAAASGYAGREEELAAAADSAVASRSRREWPALLSQRRVWLPAGLALLAVAVLVAILSRGAGAGLASPRSVVAIDPRTNKVTRHFSLEASPSEAVFAGGAVWLADYVRGTLIRVDPRTKELKPVGLGLQPDALAVGSDAIWASSAPNLSNRVELATVDPQTATIGRTQTLEHDAPNSYIAAGAGAVWIGLEPRLIRIDQRTREVIADIAGMYTTALAANDDAVWVAEPDDEQLTLVDPDTNEVVRSIPVGASEPRAVAIGAGVVWVADLATDTVWKVDTVRNQVAQTIKVGDGPGGLALGFGAVWVANRFDGTVSRIDPATDKVTSTIRVGKSVAGITTGDGRVWVAVP